MSKTSERAEATIARLDSFKERLLAEGKFMQEEHQEDIHEDIVLSVVIPARNEFPNIAHTVHSIINAWESDGYAWQDLEIIIVDNCSDEKSIDERYYTHPLDFGTSSYLEGRGIYVNRLLRTHIDPVAGNHSARNKGAEMARGKYVFFSDAHMSYGQGFFKKMIQATDESGGLVHAAIGWMGGFPPRGGSVGMQYTLKLGEEIKGTWAPYVVVPDKWFYIAAQGHCSVMCNRRQFLDFGGYPKYHRSYGGGEFYLDMKWWMFGSSVAVVPDAVGYHLKSYRGYTWFHDDYIHNIYNIGWALGMDAWLERAYINYIRNGRKEMHDKMMEEAKKEMQSDREFIESRRVKTFDDIFIGSPWDKLNDERHGKHNSSKMVMMDTWLVNCLRKAPKYVQDIYDNSPLQKQLAELIETKLVDYVYKRGYTG